MKVVLRIWWTGNGPSAVQTEGGFNYLK